MVLLLQDRVCGLYRCMLDAAVPNERRACQVAGLSLAYSQASMFIVTAIVVYFGGAEVSSGRASFENMLKAFMSIVFASMGVAQAMVSFPEIGKAGPAVRRMSRLLYPDGGAASVNAPSLVKITADDIGSPSDLMRGRVSNLQGRVELVRVWFNYPARPDVRVLQDFSLEVPASKCHVIFFNNLWMCHNQVLAILAGVPETCRGCLQGHHERHAAYSVVRSHNHVSFHHFTWTGTPLQGHALPLLAGLAVASPQSSPSSSVSMSLTVAQCCWTE